MLVELHLIGTENRWRLSTPRVRIGRDPGCEVALPPDKYPMVSREHVFLTIENGRIRLSDNQSTNGTLVNGVATSNAMLTKLDRFRLGKDGPEFEIHILEEQPTVSTHTVVSAKAAAAMPTAVESADAANTPTRIATHADREKTALSGTVVQKAEAIPKEGTSRVAPPSVHQEATASLSREDEEMIQQKLNSLRNLVYLLVAMVAVLLGVIFYQSQQIDKNRAELNDMRRQAQSAVAQFTPQLDQRLNSFDKRLDQVDAKMKDTEDEFMNRLNRELPRMLDKYVDRKVKELSAAAPQLPQPDQK
ncbi:MAG TPA: FHA domain-containing protein [Candidatus Angelobacter sp.]|nr:FHA domain-containing protein [Candidatus Angelobacter sp.]